MEYLVCNFCEIILPHEKYFETHPINQYSIGKLVDLINIHIIHFQPATYVVKLFDTKKF